MTHVPETELSAAVTPHPNAVADLMRQADLAMHKCQVSPRVRAWDVLTCTCGCGTLAWQMVDEDQRLIARVAEAWGTWGAQIEQRLPSGVVKLVVMAGHASRDEAMAAAEEQIG